MNKIIIFLLLFSIAPFSKIHAAILLHESTTTYKQPQKILPKKNEAGISYIPKNYTKQYNMLEEIDVYKLSSYAKLLLMPHMLNVRTFQALENSDMQTNWNEIAQLASQAHGVDVNLILAVIKVESNFIADAISHVGAQGLMQIMPETAKDLGLDDPFNPQKNVDAGTRYLKEQILRFQSIELALAAYNAGPGNVIKYNGIPPFEETKNFVKKVLSFL